MIVQSQMLHRSVLASYGGAVGMSKAAEAPCLLLLLIWLRNFKWSKERRKQMALVGSRSNCVNCLFQLISPYDREDHNSLMVFDVDVELGVDFVDDRVDRVGRVGQQ